MIRSKTQSSLVRPTGRVILPPDEFSQLQIGIGWEYGTRLYKGTGVTDHKDYKHPTTARHYHMPMRAARYRFTYIPANQGLFCHHKYYAQPAWCLPDVLVNIHQHS